MLHFSATHLIQALVILRGASYPPKDVCNLSWTASRTRGENSKRICIQESERGEKQDFLLASLLPRLPHQVPQLQQGLVGSIHPDQAGPRVVKIDDRVDGRRNAGGVEKHVQQAA